MQKQRTICQNCKNEFIIEPEDFKFYEKMEVPPPTFCPECRFQRRIMFRNERVLYQRACDLCSRSIITVFSPDKPFKVYCSPCWWSDEWDAMGYGQEYDPSRPFFEQFAELQKEVPYMNLVVDHPTLVNSDYTNHAGHLKNCYLSFDCDFCESMSYCTTIYNTKDSMDVLVGDALELCYGDINTSRSFRTFFSEDCTDCNEVYFSKNCSGCHNCFSCINLKNKSYHIFNKPYPKEEYEEKMKEFNTGSFSGLERLRKEADDFWQRFPRKLYHGRRNVDVSGDYIYESKNAHHVYQVHGVEHAKFCQRISLTPAKDIYDYFEWGNNAQLIYECITVGEQANTIKFSFACWRNILNVEYSLYSLASSNLFGCIGVRNKKYCILNREYSKGEYESLRASIIEDMKKNPYKDAKGRVWKYGEFFPYDLSLFDYNESTAMQYMPLKKEEALEKGFRWYEGEGTKHHITLKTKDIPDDISGVKDSILEEVLECASCGKAFRLIKQELTLLKEFGFPVPRKCPNCRHQERLKRLNPPFVWERTCAKCGKTMQTSYEPERKEIVYCESCYLREIV